jgi:hypothetical protein
MSIAQRARGAARAVGILVRLPGREAWAFARAWWALLACRLRIRFPTALAAARLVRAELASSAAEADPDALGSARLVEVFRLAVQNHVVTPSCLPRALALKRTLRAGGVPGTLRMGMRRRAGRLEGHVWVESRGKIVGDEESFVSRYTRFRSAATGA